MMTSPDAAAGADPDAGGRRFPPLFLAAAAAALALGLVWRLFLGADHPFWADETFTAAIAATPTLNALIDDCLHEMSGPVYYSLMWGWVKIAGLSDFAFRLPNILFSVAAPAILLWRGHPDRRIALLWASLAALSIPVLHYTSDARAYSWMFLLGAAQAVLLGRLIREPGHGRAWAWAIASMLLILTHYYTLFLAAFQGLAYLAFGRKAALRTWPALLAFAPLAVWMPIHLPLLFKYAGVAWQPLLGPFDLLRLPGHLLGLKWIPSAAVAGLFAATLAFDLWRSRRRGTPFPYDRAEIAVFGASVLGVGAIYLMSLVAHSFQQRYLIPFIPGILFGLAVWAIRWSSAWRFLPAALIGVFLLFAGLRLVDWDETNAKDVRKHLSWEELSGDFEAAGVTRMAFFWDDPIITVYEPPMVARVGGFFFIRDGVPVEVVPVMRGPAIDGREPNATMRSAVGQGGPRGGRTSFVWMFSPLDLDRALGARQPPRADLWRDFDCRDYARSEELIVLGCVQKAPPARP